MTDKIDEIRARLETASPGPWVRTSGKNDIHTGRATGHRHCVAIAQNDADATLIHFAPGDLRYLLDEVERQERQIEDLQNLLANWQALAVDLQESDDGPDRMILSDLRLATERTLDGGPPTDPESVQMYVDLGIPALDRLHCEAERLRKENAALRGICRRAAGIVERAGRPNLARGIRQSAVRACEIEEQRDR